MIRLARHAMATRFELVLEGEDEVWLRAAGEAALDEIDRLEAQLSIFRPSSDLSRINARAADEPVRVEPALFSLIDRAQRIYRDTHGAFDPTVGPLMRAWGFFRDSGRMPDAEVLEQARSRTGMDYVKLDRESLTVRFERPGIGLDFGGIGKGYAVDEAIGILKEMGVTSSLLHGGTSTAFGFGSSTWKVGVSYPGDEDELLAVAPLDNAALSVSAVWGKAFEFEGTLFGHVIDPRVGRPVDGALLAAVVMPTATEADALSTALLVLGREGAHLEYPGLRSLILLPGDNTYEVIEAGLPVLPSERHSVAGT